MAVGGDILEITVAHPTFGSKVLFPKSKEDGTFDEGGFRSNDDSNAIDGGGNMIDQINRTRWEVDTTLSWDANLAEELSYLKNIAGSPVQSQFTFSHINGTVWAGSGKPVGDLKGNTNTATIAIKFAGGGQLKKIIG